MHFQILIDNELYELEFWYRPPVLPVAEGPPEFRRYEKPEEWAIDTVFFIRNRKYQPMYHKDIDPFVEKWKDVLLPEMRKTYWQEVRDENCIVPI